MFGQTFQAHDLALIGLLIVLEGVLSIDNALVLGLLARRLPHQLQKRALTYGLIGAFAFRAIAIGLASWLLGWRIVKLVGGLYLIFVAVKHFFFDKTPAHEMPVLGSDGLPIVHDEQTGKALTDEELAHRLTEETHGRHAVDYEHASSTHSRAFWFTVAAIELTDIAFAIDSILAAIALVGNLPPVAGHTLHPKLWVVVTGGMLGVILMRFAAVVFIRLLEKFPRFEVSAYLLVIVIGGKLVADWAFNDDPNNARLNFHSPAAVAFWAFWITMLACFAVGFIPKRVVRTT